MKTRTLYRDGEQIIVNCGSRKEEELRKLGWSEKKGKPKAPAAQNPETQEQPTGEA